jgi:hypothetical protein
LPFPIALGIFDRDTDPSALRHPQLDAIEHRKPAAVRDGKRTW